MSEHWTEKLREIDACSDAVEWAKDYDTFAEAWQECERGDWMLWLAGRACGGPRSKSRKVVVSAACECARTAWKWMPKTGKEAIETAEKWTRGEATLGQVRTAADAAYAASVAADAAGAAAYAAAVAADAADAAHIKCLKDCADIVRGHYREPPKLPKEAPDE